MTYTNLANNLANNCASNVSGGAGSFLKEILGPKLVLDLDSDLGVTIATGVSQWNDLSGRGNHVVQATGANQPARVLNVLDGHAAIRMTTAVRQFLARAGTFTGIAQGSFPRIYIICSYTAANPFGGVFEIATSGSSGTGFGQFIGAGTAFFDYQNATTFRRRITYVESLPAGPALWDASVSAGTLDYRKNNVSKATAVDAGPAYSGDPLTSLVVGSRYLVNTDGDMFKIVIANPAPTAPQHAAVLSYLRARYPSCGIV